MSLLLWHETRKPASSRRNSQAPEILLRRARNEYGRSDQEACGGILGKRGQKETEVTRRERARKLSKQQPDPNPAFLQRGKHG